MDEETAKAKLKEISQAIDTLIKKPEPERKRMLVINEKLFEKLNNINWSK